MGTLAEGESSFYCNLAMFDSNDMVKIRFPGSKRKVAQSISKA
jgi:hypothetical protein